MSDEPKASVFVQYKGTDICLDFHCVCEAKGSGASSGHYDGYDAYAVQCGRCGRIYELPTTLQLRLVESTTHTPIVIEEDA